MKFLSVGLMCCLICFPSHFAQSAAAQEPSKDERPAAVILGRTEVKEVPADIPTHTITIKGRALDPDGHPISGASIYLASHKAFHRLLANVKTDAQGNYIIRDLKLPIEKYERDHKFDAGRFEIYGTANGYAFSWRTARFYYPNLRQPLNMMNKYPDEPHHFVGDEPIQLDLNFKRPVPLSGTIEDENGNPIANSKVHLWNCWYAPTEEFDDSAMLNDGSMDSLYSSDYCSEEISTVLTDQNGHFSFPHTPPECRFRIDIQPPGFARRMMFATTEKPRPALLGEREYERDGMKLTFDNPREVEVQLIELKDPAHAKGAYVGFGNDRASGWGISDVQGVARLKIPPGDYAINILPPTGTPYLETDEELTVTKEMNQRFELAMKPSGVAIVQVIDVDSQSGNGLKGFDLWVERVTGGAVGQIRRQRDLHAFRSYEQDTRIVHVHRVRTDENGVLRANFEPGGYVIGVGLNLRPAGWDIVDSGGREVNLKADEPTTVTIRVRKREAVKQ